MNPQEREQLRNLFSEWYRLIREDRPGAPPAIQKRARMARAQLKDYEALARRRFATTRTAGANSGWQELLVEVLQAEGAAARARGETLGDNPLHRPENLPSMTGESSQDWERRVHTWERGWRSEEAARAGP